MTKDIAEQYQDDIVREIPPHEHCRLAWGYKISGRRKGGNISPSGQYENLNLMVCVRQDDTNRSRESSSSIEATKENGCMLFCPESHHMGLETHCIDMRSERGSTMHIPNEAMNATDIADAEVSSLLGRIPSAVGYQSTLE